MILVAIDPGPHTGVAIRYNNGNVTTQMVHRSIFTIWDLIMQAQPEAIIIERFMTNGRLTKEGQETIEVQGSIYSLAWAIKARLCIQYPMDRTPFIKQAREELGRSSKKIESHEVDAYAHLLRYEYTFKDEIMQARLTADTRGQTAALYVPGRELTRERTWEIVDTRVEAEEESSSRVLRGLSS